MGFLHYLDKRVEAAQQEAKLKKEHEEKVKREAEKKRQAEVSRDPTRLI